jgi:hypothetical protein
MTLNKKHLKIEYQDDLHKLLDTLSLEHFNQEGLEALYFNPKIDFVCDFFIKTFEVGSASGKLFYMFSDKQYCCIKNKVTGNIWCEFLKAEWDTNVRPIEYFNSDDISMSEEFQYSEEFDDAYDVYGHHHADTENFEFITKQIEIKSFILI